MAAEDKTATKRPKGRSLGEFKSRGLTPAEQDLLKRCVTGKPPQPGPRPDKRTDQNRIRADFLRFLALGGDDEAPIHETGVRVEGAWIEGSIDFEGCTLPRRLFLKSCYIHGSLTLRDAQLVSLDLENTSVGRIVGNRLRCTGTLLLWRKFVARGEVRLIGAKIDGNFDCEGGSFAGTRVALDCDAAQFGGRIFLNKNFRAAGEVRFRVATLGRGLDCQGGRFNPLTGVAFDGTRMDVVGSAFFGRGFHASREVRLIGAKISGDLGCGGGRFENSGGRALDCEGATIGNRVFLNSQFKEKQLENLFSATGEVRFVTAAVGGDFDCEAARFDCPRAIALACDGMTVGGRTLLRKHELSGTRFHLTGEARFIGAKLRDRVDCTGGLFQWSSAPAQPPQPQQPAGRKSRDDDVLSCDGAEIGGDLWLKDGFCALGGVGMVGARINGDLNCRGGKFINSGGYALLCQRLKLNGAFFFQNVKRLTGTVSLIGAHVAALADDAESWRGGADLNLDGFIYDRIGAESPVDARRRIAWLEKQDTKDLGDDFKPQPWMEIARVLYALGHEDDAKKIRIEMRRRWHRSRKPHRTSLAERASWPFAVLFDWVLRYLVGYGYRPWRIVFAFLVVYVIGFAVFELGVIGGVMAPTDAKVFLAKGVPQQCNADWVNFAGPTVPSDEEVQAAQGEDRRRFLRRKSDDEWARRNAAAKLGLVQDTLASWQDICPRTMPPEYVTFRPWLYALEYLMPVLDLHQKTRWTPEVSWESVPIGVLGAVVWFWRLVETVAVLFFTLLLVASVSGIIKRE